MEFIAVIPDHDAHLQCFREVAESVVWALNELGHESMISVGPGAPGAWGPVGSNTDPSDDWKRQQPRHIYFGLPFWRLPPDAIIYNGEQVSRDSIWSVRDLPRIYKNHTVWDYSAANAKRYQEHGLTEPAVVRPGWCPSLEGRIPQVTKTHDVVFFGSSNARREKALSEIESKGMKVLRVPFGMYGAERDAVIARAHLCVNIHYYENAIFEAVRCSYLAMNGIPVVSEQSEDQEAYLWGISTCHPDDIGDWCAQFLGISGELGPAARHQVACAKKVSLIDDIGDALERLEATDVARTQVVVPVSTQGPDLTLCMIVKDERDVIERCLASVKPYLRRWCIVDTGSTDGTQDIIREFMKDLPGQVIDRPWKEFDGSRNDAIDLARAECSDDGWLLMIDSDEILSINGELELTDGFDCYNGWVARCEGCQRWARPVFMRANKPWFFEMPRHEGLYCREHGPSAPTPVPNALIVSTNEGARGKESQYDRFMRDAKVLEAWILKHPGHTRCQHYIAQSYRDAATGTVPPDRGAMQKAVLAYLKRAAMPGGFTQETFSAWLCAAKCMSDCGYPWEQIQQTLLRAFESRPSRAEPLLLLARHYREQKQYALAVLFARPAAALPMTTDHTPDVLPDIYTWEAKEELAVILTWLSQYQEALDINQQILPLVPEHERKRISDNIETCQRMLA